MFPNANPRAKNKKRKNQKGTHSTASQGHQIQNHNAQYPMPFAPGYQNHAFATPMSQARSLENLITERSYLLNSLQQENSKATDLLRRIPSLEASLTPDGEPKEQRKMRKHLGWLKHRLGESNRQEKAILARLGQLTYEIQSIERWSQVEQERLYLLHQQQLLTNPPLPTPGLEPVGMNAIAPVFQQEGFPFPPQWSYVQWPQQPGQAHARPSFQWDPHEHPSEIPPRSPNDDEDQVSPGDTSDRTQEKVLVKATRKPPLTHRSSSMNSAELDSLSTSTTPRPRPVTQRHSIPTIPGHSTIWAPTKEERELDE